MINAKLVIEKIFDKYHINRVMEGNTSEFLLNNLELELNEILNDFTLNFSMYYDLKDDKYLTKHNEIILERMKECFINNGWNVSHSLRDGNTYHFEVFYMDTEEWIDVDDKIEILNDGQYESDGKLGDLFDE